MAASSIPRLDNAWRYILKAISGYFYARCVRYRVLLRKFAQDTCVLRQSQNSTDNPSRWSNDFTVHGSAIYIAEPWTGCNRLKWRCPHLSQENYIARCISMLSAVRRPGHCLAFLEIRTLGAGDALNRLFFVQRTRLKYGSLITQVLKG